MYSSYETSLTLETRNSFRDVSFSSYLNKADENMIQKLTNQTLNDHHYTLRKKPEEDEEIGVFGAEKYFKGEIEDQDDKNEPRVIDMDERNEEFDCSFSRNQRNDQTYIPTPSICSNGSLNSRSELIQRPKQPSRKLENKSKTKNFFSTFHCNCINKKSTQINEKKFIQSKQQFDTKSDQLLSSTTKLAPKTVRNDYFSFPVLNSTDSNLAGKVVTKNNNIPNNLNNNQLSLGKKLSLLHDWDINIQVEEDEIYIPSSRLYNCRDDDNDNDSDSSSDLFEIESFSTNGNSSFLPPRSSDVNGYAPSEVSVDWSVVTASAADFEGVGGGGSGGWRNSGGNIPVTKAKEEMKKRSGILSGCTNYKAVRVAGDEVGIGGGGRRRLSESMAVGNVFKRVIV